MPRSRRFRVRRGEQQWIEILRRLESSRLGSREFCRREGIAPSSLQRWRRRLGSVAAGGFVELVAPAATPARPLTPWSVEVVLPNGACLRFRE